ncbi:zinc-dependent alcohol dehydrogenase family protein [Nannocystaceae bacterium ST9]
MRLHRPAPVETRPLLLDEVEVPRAGPGQVLIRVLVCGICRTDLHVLAGELEPRRSPLIPGHQVVGELVEFGQGERAGLVVGQRVGVAWLNHTCGACRFCTSARENLCLEPEFTGWTVDGGFAEYMVAPTEFVHPLPEDWSPLAAAPLLCAGIIGYRCLHTTGLDERGWAGAKLGIYGFGAAGHVAIQVARHRGAEVYVCTRDRYRHQALARELGAVWVGDASERPPEPLDAAIVFAPAGELVVAGLEALDRGGTLVLGGIHMSPIPSFDYALLYRERCVRSVANNTREDARAFLREAAAIPVRTHVQAYLLHEANRALDELEHDAIRGAAVLVVADSTA